MGMFRKSAGDGRPATTIFTMIDTRKYLIDDEGGIWTKGRRAGHVSEWHAESTMGGEQLRAGTTQFQEMYVTVTCGEYVHTHTIRYGVMGGAGGARRAVATVAESNARAAAWVRQHADAG